MASISRVIAYKSLFQWIKTQGDPQSIIADLSAKVTKPEDAAFARELFFGTIKYLRKIDYYAEHFYRRQPPDNRVQQIIRLGFYQLLQAANIPSYAVVNESVELTRKYCQAKKAGFVNGVLRNFLRDPEAIKLPDRNSQPVEYLGTAYSFPDWLIEKYIARFGMEQTEKLLDFCNQPPDLYFFCNRLIINDDDLEKSLERLNIKYEKSAVFDSYYRCLDPYNLVHSELLQKGMIIIGDPAQSLAVRLLAPSSGETVLDLFAAPGGKSAALAMAVGKNGTVLASELNYERLKLMRSNLNRWRINNVFIFNCDILQFASNRKFKYILADVPCSGTGTLRRNPDLRWNLPPDDIIRQAQRQNRLIKIAAGMLEPKGRLVYSTCSLEPEENIAVIEGFLKQNSDYRLIQVDGYEMFADKFGLYEVLPLKHKSDGAFAAVIERK